ncbi:MAG: NHL repeat-containing protein [Pirellulales bacterium]
MSLGAEFESAKHVRMVKPRREASQESWPVPSLTCKPRLWLGAPSPFGLALPNATPSASQLYGPRGVWIDDERVIVADSGNHRVLIWQGVPDEDHASADVVLGQPTFSSEGPAAGGLGPRRGLFLPTSVLVMGGRLVVADAWHHRILVWNTIPRCSYESPDYVIGQDDLDSVEVNRGRTPSADTLYWPYGIAWVGDRFYVADTGNRRMLVWNGFPSQDRPADFVIGQSAFSENEENRGAEPSPRSFRWIHAIAGDAHTIWGADAGNHRILGWRQSLDADRDADWVLGQRDFASSVERPYEEQGPDRLRFPYGIALWKNCLAVADTANNRILFWRVPPKERQGSAAWEVLGQIDFGGNGENRWIRVSESTVCWPYGICFFDGMLAIADSGNNRVMLWDCRSLGEGSSSLKGE